MLNQLWRLISGPLLLLLIPAFLTSQEQGYWFTFTALAALVIFADMGFSTILLQFTAHEFSHLKFNNDKTLSGDQYHLERITSLFFFSLKWAGFMAFAILPVVLLIGYFLFNKKEDSINWLMPWIIYCTASFLVFLNSIILAFIEGCNSVGDVQKIRLYTSLITILSTVLFILNGAGLYALAFSLCAGGLSSFLIIYFRYYALFSQLLKLREMIKEPKWWSEIKPLLWRYAISWASGYFMISIFTPLAFEYYDSVTAGKVGLSLAIITAVFSIANVWMVIITPKINMLVAHGEAVELRKIFRIGLWSSLITYTIGITILILATTFLQDKIPLLKKLLSTTTLLGFSIAWLCQLIINSLAIYMRAHKKEPLMLISFLLGLYIFTSTLIIVKTLSSEYIYLGFLSAYLWGLPWSIHIFKKSRKKG